MKVSKALLPQFVVVKTNSAGKRRYVQVSGHRAVHVDPRPHTCRGPGVIVLISTKLDSKFDVPQTSEIGSMDNAQKKFCNSMEDGHYWAVSAQFPAITISRENFNLHKNQYVLVGQLIAHHNAVLM